MRSFRLLARLSTKSKVTIPKSLTASDHLLPRHIGPNAEETKEMLKFVEASSLDDLMKQTISAKIVDTNSLS
jgi:glycine cleavage system pyridoxal-binding protein P